MKNGCFHGLTFIKDIRNFSICHPLTMSSRIPVFNFRYTHIKEGIRGRYVTDARNQPILINKSAADNQIQNNLTHGTYGALLFDPRWRTKRSIILDRDGYKCIICGSSFGLQVHHRQYHFLANLKQFKPPWDYEDHLLISLCEICHKKGHRQYKVPTINI